MYSFKRPFQCCDQHVDPVCIIMVTIMHCCKNQLLSGKHRAHSCNQIFNEFTMHLCCAHKLFPWFLRLFMVKFLFQLCKTKSGSSYGHFISEQSMAVSSVKPPDWFKFQSRPFLFLPPLFLFWLCISALKERYLGLIQRFRFAKLVPVES